MRCVAGAFLSGIPISSNSVGCFARKTFSFEVPMSRLRVLKDNMPIRSDSFQKDRSFNYSPVKSCSNCRGTHRMGW